MQVRPFSFAYPDNADLTALLTIALSAAITAATSSSSSSGNAPRALRPHDFAVHLERLIDG